LSPSAPWPISPSGSTSAGSQPASSGSSSKSGGGGLFGAAKRLGQGLLGLASDGIT
jgi:hypothetical protein